MKIKKTSFFVGIIVFVLLLPSVIFILSNLAFGPGNNYVFSNNMNKYLEKIFPKNEKIHLKKGDYYYRLGEYEKALQTYVKINCKTEEVCFSLSYNLGNTYYRLGENNPYTNEKIGFWQKSLSSYQKALGVKEDENTRKNYEFVLKKLNDLMNDLSKEAQTEPEPTQSENKEESTESKEQEQTNQTQEESPQDSSQDGEEAEEGEENQSQNQQNETQPRGPSIKIDENALDKTKQLSPQEKEAVEAYLKELQEEEKNNIHLNKPREQRDIFDILRDDFMFDNLNTNQNGW